MKITLNCVFKNPKGEQKTALLFLNRFRDETWWCAGVWIGKNLGGDTESAALFHPEIYLKDGDAIIALVKGVGIEDSVRDIGDTGTGKLYAGSLGRYPVPLDFNWEVVTSRDKSTVAADDIGPVD
jgi:hypothetical protein